MGGDCIPTLAMVLVQVGFAGLNVVSKLALDDGMSPYVMITYRQIVATLFIAPIAFFLERKTRMAISGKIIFQIFLCSLFGATANQLLYFLGLKYSTPTIASALNNMLPAITFVMAVPFRMETIGIRTLAGQAKVIGTVLCVGGSMEMTFYKGSLVKIWSSRIHWRYAEGMASSTGGSDDGRSMALGAALIIASCIAWAVWFIIQAKMSESFSSPYTSSALLCFMAAIQCLVIGAGVERKLSAWRLGWDIRLVTTLYNGVVGSALAVSLMSWCIEKKGPLYVSMFSPLQLVVVAVLGWAVLDERLYVGSVTGSILIVGGLYLVLWGKGRELKKLSNIGVKNLEEEVEEGGGSVAISMPMYRSPDHEARDGQPRDGPPN
ncbi:WAT1-related protein At1g09380 [Phoenix dactylifera]|uniref:WAT1-related protein n=1 Tax=Phoenix dactylifera TaxID=42345 RepID=A0A8B7BLK3_PHODC|nr:WAT1-related protein At1g09380 [Phoenix dactylifera]